MQQQSSSRSWMSPSCHWLSLVLGLVVVVLLAAACVSAPATTPPAGSTPAALAATNTAPVAPTVNAPVATVASGSAVTTTTSGPTAVALKSSSLPSGVDADGNFYLGDARATVKLLEYSDFQCPYCSRHALETGPQIDQAYIATGKAVLVFRNFPLDIHPNAMPAAKAALCAGQQKPALFWAMHDWLFTNQNTWSSIQDASAEFRKQAVAAGADGAQYDKCVAAAETTSHIQKDIADGAKQGVQGTPAFFINDWFVNGAVPFQQFQQTIEKAIAGQHPAPTPTPLPAGAKFYDPDPSRDGLTYDGSPTLGDGKAPLLLIAFDDLKCADCGQFFKDVLPTLRDKYVKDGKLRIVYFYYPSEGPKAAVAAACASRQGKFWEFADALYTHQADWKDGDNAAMAKYAKDLSLDDAKFSQCLSDASAQAQINSALSFGQDQVGVPQVPAFLLIDLKQSNSLAALVGSQPLSAFTAKLDQALSPAAQATTAPAAGATPAPTATATK
jgi:protein-disulfide isomerase